jgi:hypothetical protein
MKNKFPSHKSLKIDSDKDTKILSFLRAVPHLEFTSTGINNIAKRFGVMPEHLFILIDFVRNGGVYNGN